MVACFPDILRDGPTTHIVSESQHPPVFLVFQIVLQTFAFCSLGLRLRGTTELAAPFSLPIVGDAFDTGLHIVSSS